MSKLKIPFSEFSFAFSRSGGAGGQNVNKVNSKVILIWDIDQSPSLGIEQKLRFKSRFRNFILDDGTVQLVSQESRSQKMNIDLAIEKLQQMITAIENPPKIRRPTKPKRSAVLKRLQSKKKDSEKKKNRRKDY